MKIVFFGTSDFAARILEYLLVHHVNINAVVTRTDKPSGRNLELTPPPVKERLQKKYPNIPLFQPKKASAPEFADQLRTLDPDLFIVVAYGEIIKKNLLDLPKKGCINVHASILPHYRGAAPMQRALMDGVHETGVTIMEMNERMDEGDIIEIVRVPVPESMNLGELDEQLFIVAAPALLRVIHQKESGTSKRIPQDHSAASFASKINSEEAKINWNLPAYQVHNLIRALSPYPSAWCMVNIGGEVKRLKIKKSAVVRGLSGQAGENLAFGKEGWIVACKEDALSLLEVQLEGKKSLKIEDFVKGINKNISVVLS